MHITCDYETNVFECRCYVLFFVYFVVSSSKHFHRDLLFFIVPLE